MISSRIANALARINWNRQNLRLRKVLTSTLIAPLIVIIGPAVDLITAPAANADGYELFSSASGGAGFSSSTWEWNGTGASVYNTNDLIITTASNSQSTAARWKTKFDLRRGMDASFSFKVSGGSSPPADGFTFALTNGSTSTLTACCGGGAIGYEGSFTGGEFAVGFKTYTNNVIGIYGPSSSLAYATTSYSFAKDTEYYVRIVMDSTEKTIENRYVTVYFSTESGLLTANQTELREATNATYANKFRYKLRDVMGSSWIDSTNLYYANFTGGTGGANQQTDIYNFRLRTITQKFTISADAILPDFAVDQSSYSYTPAISGGLGTKTYSISRNGLPTRVGFNTSTGNIYWDSGGSYTPGTYPGIVITGTDQYGETATTTFTMKLKNLGIAPTFDTQTAFSETVTVAINNYSSNNTYRYSLSSGSLDSTIASYGNRKLLIASGLSPGTPVTLTVSVDSTTASTASSTLTLTPLLTSSSINLTNATVPFYGGVVSASGGSGAGLTNVYISNTFANQTRTQLTANNASGVIARISGNNKYLGYVSLSGSVLTLNRINVLTNAIDTLTVTESTPYSIAMNQTGSKMYVIGSAKMYVGDFSSNSVSTLVASGLTSLNNKTRILISPDESTAYLNGVSTFYKVILSSGTIYSTNPGNVMPGGAVSPNNLYEALSPDGKYAYLSLDGTYNIVKIRLDDNSLPIYQVYNVDSPNHAEIAINPEGTNLYFSALLSGQTYFTKLNLITGAATYSTKTSGTENYELVTISPDGKLLYFGTNSALSASLGFAVYDTNFGIQFSGIGDTSKTNVGIVISSDNATAYRTTSYSNTVEKIPLNSFGCQYVDGSVYGGSAGNACLVKAIKPSDGTYATSYSNTASITLAKGTLSAPATVTASTVARVAKTINVSWTAVSNAYSYVIYLKDSTGVTTLATMSVNSSTLSRAITSSDYASMLDGETYTVAVVASGDLTHYDTSTATSASTTTNKAALVPSFGTPTRISGGFTVQITNYNSAYSWETLTASVGSNNVSLSASGLITVTGLLKGQGATVSVSTNRTGYLTGSATSTTYYALESQATVSVTKTSGTYPNETLTATGGSGTGGFIFTVSDVGTAKCSISGTSISAQAAGTCAVIATRTADADYLTESSTATTFTFNAATALTVRAVGATVGYKATSQYNPAVAISGFVSTDSATVTSPTYTYLGINGTSYSSSAAKPTAVGTYSVTPSAGTFTFSQGYLAGYTSPVNYVSDTLTVVASIPDSPTAVSVTVLSSTSVSVSFTAPTNTGGVAIDSYLVSNTSNAVTATGTSSPIIVTGLSVGTAYTFKVNAINSAGRSDTATATQVYTKLGIVLNPTSVTGYYGTPITNITPTIYGGSGITYAVSPTLPAGLSVAINGTISGTPTETKTATTYTETATYGAYTNGSATFTLTILNGDASVTTPSVSPPTPTFGSTLTFTSTVTSVNSRATLTGTISFKDAANSILCTTPTISAGVGSCTYTPPTADTFTVRAFYSGMTYVDTAISSALTIVPTKVNPSITAAASATKLLIGATSTVTATIVTGTATNATGVVSFTSNNNAISGCTSVSVASNIATCAFSSSSTGTFVVAATYAGDSNYNGAASSSVTITVSSCTQSSSGLTLSTGAPAAGYCAVSITAGSSGSLGLPVGVESMTARIMIIGGGGSGGTRAGAGGGAGSLIYSASFAISDTKTVTIGSGGASFSTSNHGQSGTATTFGLYSASGGGGGAKNNSTVGDTGGSGGGGAGTSGGTAGGASQSTYGGIFSAFVSAGGIGTSGNTGPKWTGGGGGGAGGTGGAGVSEVSGGTGGAGKVMDMTLDGSYACFAAGGGGGADYPKSGGSGGSCTGNSTAKVGGDGSAGGSSPNATAGVANTGSGGGGSGFGVSGDDQVDAGSSGAGGTGLVALRYISPATITVSNDLTVASNTSVTLVAASITFTNLSARTYQWQKWDSATAAWKNETSTALTYTFTSHYSGVSIQKYRILVTDSDGTLQTVSSSRVVNLTVTPLTQPTLVVSTTFSVAGGSLSLLTSGGGGLGAVSYTYVSSGSAAECSLSGSVLSLATSGICKVFASKAADLDYLAIASDTTTISFVSFQMTVQARPTNPVTGIATSGTTTTSKGADACSSGCVPTISSLSIYTGRAGDSLVITGTNLSGVTKVIFNAFTNAITFSNDLSTPDTKISVQVPTGLTPGETGIEVVTPGGTSARNFDFEVLP